MKYSRGYGVVVATVTAAAVTAGGASGAWAAAVTSTPVVTRDTSSWVPPSPDPSGIAYNSKTGRLLVSDGEVDEMSIYAGANLFETTLTGEPSQKGTTLPWSNEPTGIAYNAANGHAYVADDDKKQIFELASGTDGVFGTADDGGTSTFKTSTFGNTDPEDVAYDSLRKELLLVDGVGMKVFRLNPGLNGTFNGVSPSGDDVATEFDLSAFGAQDPEGIAYDAARDTIVVVDGSSDTIYELDNNGSLLNTIDITAVRAVKAAGITLAPASDGSGKQHYYVVDRGLDNNSHPGENDGRIHEIAADLSAITNRPPAANAGPDQMIDVTDTAQLASIASDDGVPGGPLAYSWSKLSGPGTVTFGSATAAATTAKFSAAGTYVLRSTVSDSKLSDFDDITVTVYEPGAARTVAIPVSSGADDALEGGGSSGKFVNLASADNELGTNGTVSVLTGLRFVGIPVPKGGEILSAKIQFKVDETNGVATALNIRGEAADNAPTYVSTAGNISARPGTQASVAWEPPAWTVIGEVGPDQATPDLKAILQEIVNRPGWAQGNAAAFMISGTGRRTAEAKDGLSAPVLNIEFKTAAVDQPPDPTKEPTLTAALTDREIVVGTRTSIKGTLSPAVEGQTVQLQRWRDGTWRGVDTRTMSGRKTAGFRFTVTPMRTGLVRYRVVAETDQTARAVVTTGLRLAVYRAGIMRIMPLADAVRVKNTGAVRISLEGWTLTNRWTGRVLTMPKFTLWPGRIVRIRTGAGVSGGDDLYLGKRDVWGTHGVADLRDPDLKLASRFRY